MIEGLKRLMRGESNIDFIGRSKIWLTVSLVVLAISGAALAIQGLNLGLEFKGGSSLTVPLKNDVEVADIEDALRPVLPDAEVQVGTRSSGQREALVRTRETGEAKLDEGAAALARVAGQTGADGQPLINEVSRKVVGPSWGRQVSQKALRGLIVFLILVSLYISMRFEPKMAAGALAALFHDLVATAGIYALTGFEVTPATVIALLTLMGFSLYDTVVVFDRVRENAATIGPKTTYSDMVNRSMNEVLVRSINTSLSSLLPVAGLLFVGVFLFGAVTLKDLSLAMFVGTAVSTYSSIFVASPLLAWLKEREPKYRAVRSRATTPTRPTRVPQAREASAPVSAASGSAAVDTAERTDGEREGDERITSSVRPAGSQAIRVQRGTPKPRKRKRGGKRR